MTSCGGTVDDAVRTIHEPPSGRHLGVSRPCRSAGARSGGVRELEPGVRYAGPRRRSPPPKRAPPAQQTIGGMQQSSSARRRSDWTDWAYSTVRRMPTRLAEKGAVRVTMDANVSVFAPSVSRTQARRSALRLLLDRAFDGTVGSMIQHLFGARRLSDRERDELRALIEAEGARKSRKSRRRRPRRTRCTWRRLGGAGSPRRRSRPPS